MKLQDDLLNDLEKPNSRDFWKQISNKRQNTILFEVLGEDGDIITDKKAVLDQWESDNGTLFDENMQQSAYGDRHLKYVKHANWIGLSVDDNQIPDISFFNAPISRKEVEDAVKRLKLRKAAGIGNMIAFCFENGVSPIQWKQGISNPIVKSNSTDYRLPLTYRGITLLSVPCRA